MEGHRCKWQLRAWLVSVSIPAAVLDTERKRERERERERESDGVMPRAGEAYSRTGWITACDVEAK